MADGRHKLGEIYRLITNIIAVKAAEWSVLWKFVLQNLQVFASA